MARTAPAFVFLDPFGVKTLPFGSVVDVLRRIGKTEVLIRVDVQALRRIAGHVKSEKGSAATIAVNDLFLGGDWWQSLDSIGEPGFAGDVLSEYVRRLSDAAGGRYGHFWFPVGDDPEVNPAYWLVHMSEWTPAFWEMNQAISVSYEDTRALPSAQLSFDDDLDETYVFSIYTRVSKLLEEEGSFVPCQHMSAVYGGTLGLAREKHLRKALRRLYAEGAISVEPRGALARKTIS